MIAVIFELQPDRSDHYPELAEALQAQLRRIPGHISVERFESLSSPGKYLSLSFFTDEDAVAQWRDLWGHRAARAQAGTLGAYRLRLAYVGHDYGTPRPAGTQATGGTALE